MEQIPDQKQLEASITSTISSYIAKELPQPLTEAINSKIFPVELPDNAQSTGLSKHKVIFML